MSATSQVIYLGSLRTDSTHLGSGHSITTDAPLDNNGKGQKFSPTDLAATSLASCMLTVMGIAAQKRDITFSAIKADVTKIMASNPRRIAEVHIELHINHPEWTEKERNLMENTALNCPVAKSLHPDIKQKVRFNYQER
ncbi:MAG: OsmC family protein [Bacteroidia bacterium]|nr:OsmC family protein [Bacteroidia bacterium]